MTCKDCLHYEACESMLRAIGCPFDGEGVDADKRCDTFADRSRYVVREKGEWIKRAYGRIVCSECECRAAQEADEMDYYQFESNFCPNCGADMRKGENG